MNERTLEHVNNANLYLNNQLRVKKNFEIIDITEGIDWTYEHDSNAKTYQVYLHSLGIIKSLVITSKHLDESKYLQAANDLINKWGNGVFDRSNSQAWHEHAVSSRLQNIIYFQNRAGTFKLEENEFQSIILTHCEFLSKKENYQENNHGIMMDNALIFASKSLIDNQLKKMYLEKAYYRVKMALYRDFSKMGVHLENSPEYHKMVLNLFDRVSKNLASVNMPLGKDVGGLFNRANMYSSHMLKPNKELPIIGDSGVYEENIAKKYTDFVDYEAGILISQYKNLVNEKMSSWMFFKSGYRSKTHKHKDDLSVNLFMNGHDILVDSGKYGYNIKDPKRKFIVSTAAHNTVYFKDKNYVLSNPYSDQIKLKTTRFVNRGKYKISTGINNLFEEGNITRHAILTSNNIMILLDKINSTDVNEVIQNFNFPETATITKIEENIFEIKIENKVYILESFNVENDIPVGTICDGLISYKFGKSVDNKRVEFLIKDKKFSFLTMLYENIDNKRVRKVSMSGHTLKYQYDKDAYSILI